MAGGDFEALLRVLDPDVQLTVDIPGEAVVTIGATRVAAGARTVAGTVVRQRPVLLNGRPGYVAWQADGTLLSSRSRSPTAGSPPSRSWLTPRGSPRCGFRIRHEPARTPRSTNPVAG
ncbi:hypothetical protein AB0B66_13560 [Catellatospora sp. NPDC049111]|uniref:hypothetical protein n=1 Tax=Catellatospora sp. NPDC049111 TaxID=3155271 RepID=UPI0033D0B699